MKCTGDPEIKSFKTKKETKEFALAIETAPEEQAASVTFYSFLENYRDTESVKKERCKRRTDSDFSADAIAAGTIRNSAATDRGNPSAIAASETIKADYARAIRKVNFKSFATI